VQLTCQINLLSVLSRRGSGLDELLEALVVDV
jgi:hypothetical protein